MKIRATREQDAKAIATALSTLYPSYRFEAKRWPKNRLFSVAVYCKATNALLKTAAEI